MEIKISANELKRTFDRIALEQQAAKAAEAAHNKVLSDQTEKMLARLNEE